MKKAIVILTVLLAFVSCKQSNSGTGADNMVLYECPMHCEGDRLYEEEGTCPVCKMDLERVKPDKTEKSSQAVIPEMSIFNLSSTWTDQNGKAIKFKDLQGDVLVMVMIYTSCKAACPRLVADMRNIEARLSEEAKNHIKMIFVSIDPETDTPARLKSFAEENFMDDAPWMFLRSTEENTREFAAVVAVSYKEISPIDFSHSNIISVFSHNGEMLFQQEGLGVNSDNTVNHINKAVGTLKKEL